MKKACCKLYFGMGDCVNQVPFVKKLTQDYDEVYLQTYFPFLFSHLPNVKFVLPPQKTPLQTCQEQMKKYRHLYIDWIQTLGMDIIEFPYYLQEFRNGKTLVESFNSAVPVSDELLNEPLFVPKEDILRAKNLLSKLDQGKKFCIVRPPANRKDWDCSARIPEAKYFQYIIDKYKDYFTFISIGNKKNDVFKGHLAKIDYRFENGELDLLLIVALTKCVDFILTYNCFLFPLGVKNYTKTLVLNGGFSDPWDYVDKKRMKLDHLQVVNPDPFEKSLNLTKPCNKNINYFDLDYAMSKLFGLGKKKNLLVSRIRHTRCSKLLQNPFIKDNFNLYTVDHTGLFDYKEKGFVKSYQFPSVGNVCEPQMTEQLEKQIETLCKKIITDNKIDVVINAQPLHPYNVIMNKVCKEQKIDVFNYETFFDDKFVLDRVGSQYTTNNEINQFVEQIKIPENAVINFPKLSREKQPDFLNVQQVYSKYHLSFEKNYIVMFGQLLWDYSLQEKFLPQFSAKAWYKKIFRENPETTFLFKIHPKINATHPHMSFLSTHENVIIVNESLDTLFNAFDCFASFSSHCILEGLFQQKKFATGGYHYVNHPELVYQLTEEDKFKDLYNKLQDFNINDKLLQRYLYFICNLYTCDSTSYDIFKRLTLSSEEYFNAK